MKKRIISILLASVMALSLIACSKDSNETSEQREKPTEDRKEIEETVEEEPAANVPAAGAYASSYEEEYDGETYTFNTYLIINGDGTGTWVVQDTCDITYDDSNVNTVYNDEVYESFPYEYKDNSIFLDEGFGPNEYKLVSDVVPTDLEAWLAEQDGVEASGQCVEPLAFSVDCTNPDDGEYWILMDSFEECQDSYGMKCTLYLIEQYDSEAIKALQPGDVVCVDGGYMDVNTVDFSGSLVIINGGEEEGGTSFRVYDDEPTCQVAGMDDFPTYFEVGPADLFVPADCVITDSSDIIDHPEGIVMNPKEFKKAMSDPGEYWYWNTSIVVKDNEIKEINIRFVP